MKVFGNVMTGAVLQRRLRAWTPGEGWETTFTYEGLEAPITALAAQMKAEGAEVDIAPSDGPTKVLTARFNKAQDGAAEESETTWEFPSAVLQNDILACKKVIAYGLPDAVMEALRAYRDGKCIRSGVYSVLDGRNVIEWTSTADNADVLNVKGDDGPQNGMAILLLMLAGVEVAFDSQTIVRISDTVSSTYAVTASRAAANKLLTTAQLTALVAPPPDVKFQLPTDPVSNPPGFKECWLGSSPDVARLADGRWKITQEFTWALWALALYDVFTP